MERSFSFPLVVFTTVMTTLMVTTLIVVVIVVVVVPVLVAMLVLALALALLLARRRAGAVAERASSDGCARDRHRCFREGITVEGSTGEGDRCTRENRSPESRVRHRHGFRDPPVHVV